MLRVTLVPTLPEVGAKLTPQSPPAQPAPSTIDGKATTPSTKTRVSRHVNLAIYRIYSTYYNTLVKLASVGNSSLTFGTSHCYNAVCFLSQEDYNQRRGGTSAPFQI